MIDHSRCSNFQRCDVRHESNRMGTNEGGSYESELTRFGAAVLEPRRKSGAIAAPIQINTKGIQAWKNRQHPNHKQRGRQN